jgi:decaprenylphospho-beta-D-ribofuranose 2-oxidase
VFKRHRADDFLMSYATDGYSLALDFKVTDTNRRELWRLAADLDAVTIAAGGRHYFAKDSTLHPSRITSFLAEERVTKFLAIKHRTDPDYFFADRPVPSNIWVYCASGRHSINVRSLWRR